MPRVISDELFDQLTGCLRQQRLLGVMGMIERMEKESLKVKLQEAWTNYYECYIWAAEDVDTISLEGANGQEQQANSN